MSPKEILKRMIDLDVTQSEIARREGVSVAAVGQTIHGRTVSRRLRKAIAEAIGLAVEEVWPPKEKAA